MNRIPEAQAQRMKVAYGILKASPYFMLVVAGALNAADLFVGVPRDATEDQVASVIVNTPQARGRDFDCVIVSLASDSLRSGVLPGSVEPVAMMPGQANLTSGVLPAGVVTLAMKPGRYTITAGYRTHLKGGQATVEKMFEAGARYEVACVGKTYNQLRIRVDRLSD